MAIYDCFQFFNEEHILDLRLNILNEFVDFFVMVESTTDHQGNSKKLNFNFFANNFPTELFPEPENPIKNKLLYLFLFSIFFKR